MLKIRSCWILQCEPLSGFGFRRGGYRCVCKPGYRYPWWHNGPFLGWEIEQATKEEYENSFDCLTIGGKLSYFLEHTFSEIKVKGIEYVVFVLSLIMNVRSLTHWQFLDRMSRLNVNWFIKNCNIT